MLMPIEPPDPIFLDTSIQIARTIHYPAIRAEIEGRLRDRREIVSGLVVRQEFKRRLLRDAKYLLKQLIERNSFTNTLRHVASLPAIQRRKMSICLNLLATIDEEDSENDRLDRAKLILHDLIKNGISTSEARLSNVVLASGCACALQPIIEKRRFVNYDFGKDRCSATDGKCKIRTFLEDNRQKLKTMLEYLQQLIDDGSPAGKTGELQRAQQFIENFFRDPSTVESANPCTTVGDLLIALESANCATIYTMNLRESQHFIRALNQAMIYRSPNPEHAEEVHTTT